MNYPFKHFLYGADYNPEQWLHMPGILEADIKMMKEAHVNVVSIGMFSWAKLEPQEGQFDFSWLDHVLDRLAENDIGVFLATPSGAKPGWMSHKYPEIRRTDEYRRHALHGARHNHCMTSPVYREKTALIDSKLAERYAHHKAVIGWHLSNEYGGYCYCDKCQAKFREWLKERYKTLDNLNQAYWSTFWSHTYSSWDEIEAPSPIGENAVHALNIDWRRFSSYNALDFCKMERDIVRKYNPNLMITTNLMEYFKDYDYFEWAKELDIVSWDSYPKWHYDNKDPMYVASYTAMNHDLMRSLLDKPFLLMESTPSMTNWRELSTLKRPNMNILASMQAVAHGANSVQYFQWRKSRGSSEKFHGAVVDHVGHINTRVGREVCDLGAKLEASSQIINSNVKAKVAIIFDTQNRWALEDSQGPRNQGMHYIDVCLDFYRPFYERGISVDIIDETCNLDKYDLVIGPMLYMIRDNFAQKVEKFVANGGNYLSSFWSGVVNETDLCFLDGFPGPLKNIVGIWEEEIDSLNDEYRVPVRCLGEDNGLAQVKMEASMLCGLAHVLDESKTKVMAVYDGEFYKNMPVFTETKYEKGHGYYLAARMNREFYDAMTQYLVDKLNIKGALGDNKKLTEGISAQCREGDDGNFVFIGNYTSEEKCITLNKQYVDVFTNEIKTGDCKLDAYGVLVLKCSE